MVATKPAIVFVPGFWHTSDGFKPLTALLEKENYSTTLIDLPSAGAHPGHPDNSEDVKIIRNVVADLADGGKDVLLVMHSGGSIPGIEAVEGLGRKEREVEGKKGGVVRVFYIGILLPETGKSIYETFQAVVASPELDPDFLIDPDQAFHVIAEVTSTLPRQRTTADLHHKDGTPTITDGDTRFYNDLPVEKAKYWSSKLTSLSLGYGGYVPIDLSGVETHASAYAICLRDKTIPPKQDREIVKNANIVRIFIFKAISYYCHSPFISILWTYTQKIRFPRQLYLDIIFEIDTGRCGYLSQPETVAGFIRQAAGETI
ncbi:hypothetical protein D0Z07_4235 [Hyphodiscus hymeniophilus]|uniref:AB hydrolase-1 domain-containing protein n=1 Tax=Hyphodiscus hymeniophilus TaxID=353542 RepID=A0A9P6VJ95_9HELO|nr:hypothetical protein D0Z07_4235 [Hyphodiscus hymeniophilus]